MKNDYSYMPSFEKVKSEDGFENQTKIYTLLRQNKIIGEFDLEGLKKNNVNNLDLIMINNSGTFINPETVEEIMDMMKNNYPTIPKEFIESNELSNSKNVESSESSINKYSYFNDVLSFNGKINRLEYLISIIIYIVAMNVFKAFKIGFLPYIVLMIPFMYFFSAQSAKRCHDIGRSGWFQMIPGYFLVLLFKK